MSRHHEGAILMAGEAMAAASDPRVRLIAQGIRHTQRNKVAVMRKLRPGGAPRSRCRPWRRRPRTSGTATAAPRVWSTAARGGTVTTLADHMASYAAYHRDPRTTS